jgi:hypothetical protein
MGKSVENAVEFFLEALAIVCVNRMWVLNSASQEANRSFEVEFGEKLIDGAEEVLKTHFEKRFARCMHKHVRST